MAYTITIKALFTGFVILAATVWVYYSFEVFPLRRDIEISAYHLRKHNVQDSSKVKRAAHFPLIIHTMWKSPDSSPPAETVRWRKGCQAVNPDHEFKMYYDKDLLEFVKTNYPKYLALYQSLKGVYMADMARVLVIYHYGGIYMDLDFYCHRPFSCISDRMLPLTSAVVEEKDILIVSLEPTIHANIFRDKDRVVIQDFYMSTVRHPFFKWFLDDRLQKFNENPTHPAKGPFSYSIEVDIDAYHKSIGVSADGAHTGAGAGTGGLDSHISSSNSTLRRTLTDTQSHGHSLSSVSRSLTSSDEKKDPLPLDSSSASADVHTLLTLGNETMDSPTKHSSTSSIGLSGVSGGYIHELREDILHSLVDSTNPRLNIVCSGKVAKEGGGEGENASKDKDKDKDKDKSKEKSSMRAMEGSKSDAVKEIPSWAIKSCEKVRAKKYFSPSDSTIAVHMWTHTFLGWSFFRGMYNSGVYAAVERQLAPSMQCPSDGGGLP